MPKLCVLILPVIASTFAFTNAADVKISPQSNHLSVTTDGKSFTDYWFGPRNDRRYVRPFFYPVLADDGTPLTSDHHGQIEHPHHQSMWIGQGDVNGADHWGMEGDNPPRQRHIKFEKVEGDTAIEDLQWEDKSHKPILAERRTLRFVSFADGSRGIEFVLEFTPIAVPVTFGDTKEAGLVAIRMNDAIPKDHPVLTDALGRHGEKETWGKAADWCDISGQINGKEYGIACFDSLANPRHPTRWHVREYGLLAANPFGLSYFDKGTARHTGDMKMQPGTTTTFKYLVVAHEGDAGAAHLADKYRAFVRSGP